MGTGTKTSGLLVAASLVIVAAGLKAAAPVLLPLLLGLLGAILALPVLGWLRSRRVPSALSIALTALSGFALLAGMLVAVERSLAAFISVAPRYQERLGALADDATRWLAEHGIAAAGDAFKQVANPAVLIRFLQLAANALAGLLSQAILIFFITIFILIEADPIAVRIRTAATCGPGALSGYMETVHQVQRYLGLKTLVSLGSATLTSVWAALLGIDFVPLWGLLSFVFGFIPNIGSLFSTIPPVLVAYLQFGPTRSIATLVGYVVIQTIIGNAVEPRLMGRSFGLSTLAVFMALLFWGWLWGPVGMFLSVPLLMVLKIASYNIPDLRWLANLLGTVPQSERESPPD